MADISFLGLIPQGIPKDTILPSNDAKQEMTGSVPFKRTQQRNSHDQLPPAAPLRKTSVALDYHSPRKGSTKHRTEALIASPAEKHDQSNASGKRRSQLTNVTHLLNFSLPQRQTDPFPQVSIRRKHKSAPHTPFDKNRFINAKYKTINQ